MKIVWKGPGQHTRYGVINPGDVIDLAAVGIPESAAGPWIRDGHAELVIEISAPAVAGDPGKSKHKKTAGRKPR